MNESPKKIPLAGVIGNPISHSLSPALHQYWLKQNKLDGYYIPLQVTSELLPNTVEFLPKIGFKGVNITIPHKTNVISLVHNLTDRAALIGAVNTLHFNNDGHITGDNTDAYGFIENIKQVEPNWNATQGPAMVFGAGGAARAIVWALLSEGVPEVRITNRTKQKAIALTDILGAKVRVVDWMDAESELNDVVTLVNTTSLGMKGSAPFNKDISNLPTNSLVVDLVYNPLETDLIRQAREVGLRSVDGLGMLLHQAVPGFEKWFGLKPMVTEEIKTVLNTF